MARKLNAEEKRLFAEALQSDEAAGTETCGDAFLRSLDDKRDASLDLTPELSAWLEEVFPARRQS